MRIISEYLPQPGAADTLWWVCATPGLHTDTASTIIPHAHQHTHTHTWLTCIIYTHIYIVCTHEPQYWIMQSVWGLDTVSVLSTLNPPDYWPSAQCIKKYKNINSLGYNISDQDSYSLLQCLFEFLYMSLNSTLCTCWHGMWYDNSWQELTY